MFWSKLCKSSWNCAWNLAFPVFILPIVWNMCENLHYESVYFKELHNEQEYYWPTLFIQWIYRTGAAVMSTITSYKSAIHFDVIAEWNQMNLSRHPLVIILSRHLSEKDCCLRSLRTCFPQGRSKLSKVDSTYRAPNKAQPVDFLPGK